MNRLLRPAAALALLAPALAFAHPGHESADLAAGLTHPLAGLDHLLAMLAVGLWSARALDRHRWLGAAAFVAAMLAGAALGLAGGSPAQVEIGVAATLPLFGAMLLAPRGLTAARGLALVAAAGALHGLAHGADAATGTSFAAYAAGFTLATAALHAAGLGLGAWLPQARAWTWRAAAALLGVSGLALLAIRI